MMIDEFTTDGVVRRALDKGHRAAESKSFSDLVDNEGLQYVDLVMEGGGVLGVALLGFTWALEQYGIRFFGIGGTSAGSIVALLLAAVDNKDKPKSELLLERLASKEFFDFVDGGSRSRRLVKSFLRRANMLAIAVGVLRLANTLRAEYGINPGDAFQWWIEEILKDAGIKSTKELQRRVEWRPPGLKSVGAPLKGLARVAVISAEVGTETRVELPSMASLFWDRWRDVNPALFVRASMSIPFFFEPLRIDHLPQGDKAGRRWDYLTGWRGEVPKKAVFVDGGVMSNFPIDLFHRPERVPSHPTFGVKLGRERKNEKPLPNVWKFAGGVFDSARHCLDYTFIANNPDYRHLLAFIDTEPHGWLNFEIENDAKVDLFRRGVEEAARFVKRFDWQRYKEIRAGMAEAHTA